MAIPTSKIELLVAITERFAKLNEALDAVPSKVTNEKSMDGHAKGTMMSANDLVSYLIGWNELVLKWLDEDDRGLIVEFPEIGYRWNELGALAQKFYADHSDDSFDENRRRLTTANENLVAEISKRTDEELYGSPWHGKWTKGRMIQFNSSSPYENARGRVRKWLKSRTG
ncbi:MAG: ClbS/DfsB family four-helix bundle protein [Litoreibacter sp.]